MSSQDISDWESAPQIDPLILRLLQNKQEKPAVLQKEEQLVKSRQLGGPFATFIGVTAMMMVILLGLVRSTEADTILLNSCQTLVVFSAIGFLAGKIAEKCVQDSAKSMIREMLQRMDATQNEKRDPTS